MRTSAHLPCVRKTNLSPPEISAHWSLVVVVDGGGGGGKDDEVSSHKTGEKTAKNQQKSVGSLLRTSTE